MTSDVKLDSMIIQGGPHIKTNLTIPKVMYSVVVAMLPVTIWSFWAFGFRAVFVITNCIFFTLLFEYAFLRFRTSRSEALRLTFDGSALVSGILLGLNLGPGSPWWLAMIGSLVAMGIGKHVFGGLGCNPFNPVLVARVFLLLSFPVEMTTWFSADRLQKSDDPLLKIDGITSATPLGALKEGGWESFLESFQQTDLWNYILLNKGGCLGDVSIFMLLIGAVILLATRVISLHIPLSYLGTVAVITGLAWKVDPTIYANPLFHLATGSLVLGAFFMATDMVTTPITPRGQIIFGAGCGIITAVIRLWGGFPEGVSFAILIMNGLVPLIDRWTKPKILGETSGAGKNREGAK